jgi:hypothetical protein
MSGSRRRSLAEVISPAALDTPAIPVHPPTAGPPDPEPKKPAADPEPRKTRRPAATKAPTGAPPRPTARELATPVRGPVAREALKADVPADLGLLQRLRRYRLDNGMDIRDQVAIAVDEWLTSEGY